ncbi:hypothetical protein RFI_32574, partial [Reticulomyxa filosa]
MSSKAFIDELAGEKLTPEQKNKKILVKLVKHLENKEIGNAIDVLKATREEFDINYQFNGNTLLHYVCNSKEPTIYLFLPIILSTAFKEAINLQSLDTMKRTPLMCAQDIQNEF